MNYQITITDDKNNITTQKQFKSIRLMANELKIPYHTLRMLFRNQQQQKKPLYNYTKLNNLKKFVSIDLVNCLIK